MAGFDPNRNDEYSVSSILREINEQSNPSAAVDAFSLEEILSEFGSQSTSVTTPETPSVKQPVSQKEQKPKPKEKPVKTRKEKPVKMPKEKPVKVPKEKPVKVPKEQPVKKTKKKTKKQLKSEATVRKAHRVNPEEARKNMREHFGPQQDRMPKKKKQNTQKASKPTVRRMGPSISPQEYVATRKGAVRLRGVCAVMLFLNALALFYLCFAANLHIPIPAQITFENGVELHHFLVLGLYALAVTIGFPVVFAGVREVLKLRLGLSAAVMFTQLANLAPVVFNLLSPAETLQKPYAPVAVFTLFFAVFGMWKRENAYLRSAKAAGMSKEPLGIYSNEWYHNINIIKQPVRDDRSFARHLESEDKVELTWNVLAPLGIAAALIFSVMVGIVSRDWNRFFWTLAAVSCAATPFVAMFGFSTPFAILSRRLSRVGSSLAGWYAADLLSGRQNLIVRDSDLFPKGAVSFNGIRMLGSFSLEQALSYATSIFKEANNGLFPVFYEELKSKFGRLVPVRNMRHYEYGGAEAELEGNLVYVGTGSFMTRMGVHLGAERDAKNVVFIAINGTAAALFQMKYRANEEIRESLFDVLDAKITPILAVVDFNLVPMMVEEIFDLPQNSLEYPNIEERLDLATESRYLDHDPCAFVTRSGFVPFASCVLAAKRLRRVTARNALLTALCVFFGLAVMFCLAWIGNIYASSPYHIFWYQLLWMVPVLMHSQRVK